MNHLTVDSEEIMFGNKMKRTAFGQTASNAMNIPNAGNGSKNGNGKRKLEGSPGQEVKRCALGDISNVSFIKVYRLE